MRRLRFGPVSSSFTAPLKPTDPIPPTDPVVPSDKEDVAITIRSIANATYPAVLTFAPQAYDPAKFHPLNKVHFVAVRADQEPPTTPEQALSGEFPVFEVDVHGIVDGSPISVELVDLEPVPYATYSVLEDDYTEPVAA